MSGHQMKQVSKAGGNGHRETLFPTHHQPTYIRQLDMDHS